jgi:hypothetical protein
MAHSCQEMDNTSAFRRNVGRQFIKQFPDAEFVDESEGQLDLPLALDHTAPVELSEGTFRIVVVVSTLFHFSHLDDKYKRSVIRESFLQALRVAQQTEVNVLATTILQGGWRFTPEIAFLRCFGLMRLVVDNFPRLTSIVWSPPSLIACGT